MFALLLVSVYMLPKCNKYFNLLGYIVINLKNLLYVTLKSLLNVWGHKNSLKIMCLNSSIHNVHIL